MPPRFPQQIPIAEAKGIREASIIPISMDAAKCYQMLEQAGWFAGWPEAACESARQTLERNEEVRAKYAYRPGAAMVSVWGDTECIDGEGAYTELLRDFAKGSHGFFQPEEITEVWTRLEDDEWGGDDWSIEVTFRHRGKSYSCRMEYSRDWMDPTIAAAINEAMADCEPALAFIMPDLGFSQCQTFGCALIPQALIKPALGQSLLPPLARVWACLPTGR